MESCNTLKMRGKPHYSLIYTKLFRSDDVAMYFHDAILKRGEDKLDSIWPQGFATFIGFLMKAE